MQPTSGSLEEIAPDLHPDEIAKQIMRQRMHRLRTDPNYRAQQRLKAQIGQSNSQARNRNTTVSLPKFSWDQQ